MKKLIQLLSDFFASLFGRKKEPSAPAPPSPKPTPASNDKLPDLAEDSSDVPRDTVVTVKLEDVGPFADDDKETGVEEEEMETSQPEVPTTPTIPPAPPTPGTPGTEPVPPPPPPPIKKGRYLWCLDNGHGKLQAGKRSPMFDDGKTRFFEYEFNRDVVERMMKLLDAHEVAYFDVVPDVLTVGSFLEERVERANKKKSDLPKIYVSVHANAGPAADGAWVSDNIRGIETWYAQNSKKGQKLAAVFQKYLIEKTGMKNRNLKSTSEKSLYVLEKTSMPAILTENGFYNNKAEVKELMKDDVRQKIAEAHVAAILEVEKNGI